MVSPTKIATASCVNRQTKSAHRRHVCIMNGRCGTKNRITCKIYMKKNIDPSSTVSFTFKFKFNFEQFIQLLQAQGPYKLLSISKHVRDPNLITITAPLNEAGGCGGGYLDSPCPSVRPSVNGMVCTAQVQFVLKFQLQIPYSHSHWLEAYWFLGLKVISFLFYRFICAFTGKTCFQSMIMRWSEVNWFLIYIG